MITEAILACILSSAETHDLPPSVLFAILQVENGKTSELNSNSNGSYDLGLMQINSLWLPNLAKHWDLSQTEAAYAIVNNDCTNINVASWILKQKINEAEGSLINGIAYYHSKTPHLGKKYALKVVDTMKRYDLLVERVE